jgi:predicted DNA-binding ribbon-helix-helix protein
LKIPFGLTLKKIEHTEQLTLSELVAAIDGTREQSNLSSAIHPFVLHHFRYGGDKRMEVAKLTPHPV